MSTGQKFIAKASLYLGLVERPKGSNTGGPIMDWARYAGYSSPVPWCGCFVKAMASRKYGIGWEDMESVCHGYTGTIVDRAHANGWLHQGGSQTPAGALFVKGGPTGHVGIVLQSSSSTFRTIEGNVNDGVRSYVRSWSDGWKAVVPPGTGTASSVVLYGFENLNTKPRRYGGWRTALARDQRMASYKAAHPDDWVRPIRINTASPFAFEAGAPGTWGATYNYGPWSSKSLRDAQMTKWSSSHHGNVRTYSTRKQVIGNATDTGTKTT
jgi:hypothetical protein